MTYKRLQRMIEDICLSKPNIRSFGCGNIYSLNSLTPSYVISWLSIVNRRDYQGLSYFNFNIFYVDRLKKSLDNEEEVINEAISCLSSIVNDIKNNDEVLWTLDSAVTYTPFRERFSDACAGAYVNVTIPVILEEECE